MSIYHNFFTILSLGKGLSNFVCLMQTWQKALNPQWLAEIDKKMNDPKIHQRKKSLYELNERELNLFNTYRYQSESVNFEVNNEIFPEGNSQKLTEKSLSLTEGPVSDKMHSWKLFLQNARVCLHSKIWHEWADHFYEHLDEIYEMAKTEKDELKGMSLQESYNQKIAELYRSVKFRWETYLLLPKEGFLRYLEELTGVVF